MGFKLGEKSDLFMQTWIKYIDKKPLNKKPIGYGQTSCYLAYSELENSNIKWGNILKKWVKADLNENSIIWSGNHTRGKTKTAKIFQKELEGGIRSA